MMTNRSNRDERNEASGGGAATTGGVLYQAQVTAWWAARILLQTPEVGAEFSLSATATADRLYCETSDGIDDIRIELSDGSVIFGQCKRGIQRSRKSKSKFAEVFVQFIKETRNLSDAQNERRFVMFYERQNDSLERLRRILNRYRGLPQGTPLTDATHGQQDKKIAEDLNQLLDCLFSLPDLNDCTLHRETLLRHSYLKCLEVSQGQSGYLNLIDSIRSGLLSRPDQVHLVTRDLHILADDLMKTKGSIARNELRNRLKNVGVALKDSVTFQPDFRRLDDWTRNQIAAAEADGKHMLQLGEQELVISRPVVEEMLRLVPGNSFLVVGDAGVGKTGCLLSLVRELMSRGTRVWYLSANSQYRSTHDIASEIQLEHTWEQLLDDAASGVLTVLIIDGLDGLRQTMAMRAYRDLMLAAITRGVTLMASIRAFDLKNSVELRNLFKADNEPVSDRFLDETFKTTSHIAVSDLDESEFEQVKTHLPGLRNFMDSSPGLRQVVANLFYLDLLCQLVSAGIPTEDFSPIASQAEVFHLWWAYRIKGHIHEEEIRATLKSIVETMVSQRTLVVSHSEWRTDVRQYLVSSGILQIPPSVPGRLQRRTLVGFSHHYMFDHVAMRLFVEPRMDHLAGELKGSTNWGLFLRPSLVLFFRYAWMAGREDFWDKLLAFENSSILFLHKMAAYLVVASECASLEDLRPLLEAHRWPDRTRLIQGIVATAQYYCLNKVFRRAKGDWWLEFALSLISTCEKGLVQAGRNILHCAVDEFASLSDSQRTLLNRGSMDLINHYWQTSDLDELVPAPLTWICRTIASAPETSVSVIRSMLSRDQIQEKGYLIARPLAHQIKDIWEYDPGLAVKVYDAVFSYRETDKSVTSFNDSRILRLTSTRQQDYQSARYSLRQSFPAFLKGHPAYATSALIAVFRSSFQRDTENGLEPAVETFQWGSRDCRIAADAARIRYAEPFPDDDERQMLVYWETYLGNLPNDPLSHDKWNSIEEALISENESSEIWRSLLKAACERPQFYATKIRPLLLVPRILFGPGTRTMARNCLRNFVPHLELEMLRALQRTVLDTLEHTVNGQQHPLDDGYLTELKMMTLTAIPIEYRLADASEFLSRCDSQSLKKAEARLHESDEITFIRSSGAERDEFLETPRQNEVEIVTSLKYLAGLSPDHVTQAGLGVVLDHIRTVEQGLDQKAPFPSYKGVCARNWYLHACSAVACSKVSIDTLPTDQLFGQFRDVLCAPTSEPSDEELQGFDAFPAFDYPDPLADAAEGFVCLVTKTAPLKDEWRELLSIVAGHVHPKVRYQLIRGFQAMLTEWPEFVMDTIERWVQETAHGPGCFALVSTTIATGVFWGFRALDQSRTDQIIQQFCDAVHTRGSWELRTDCGRLIALFHIQLGTPWANYRIDEATNSFADFRYEIRGFVERACEVIFRPFTYSLALGDAYLRAQDLMSTCLTRIHEALGLISSDVDTPPEWVKEAINVFELVAVEFTRCIHKSLERLEASQQLSDARAMAAWWNSVEPALALLMMEPYPSVTYPLILGLKDMASRSPSKSVYWLAEMTRLATPYGLTSEPSAADTTMEMLEQLLADHRLEFRSDTVLSEVVDTVENYLRAGWPRAFEFATQFEGIFR